jgi:hypothetical protein
MATIKVYHRKTPTFDENVDTAAMAWNTGGFELVAEVYGSTSLDHAYRLTNTIDQAWWKNPGVAMRGDRDGCRSTSVGDIIERDGNLYVVANFGFTQIKE